MIRAQRNRDERGVVIVLISLLLTVMLISAAFAVDIGSWYARAAQIKRAADAAALAGVVWMPQIDTARDVALDTAARNGFEDGVDDIEVVVEPVPGTERQLRVTITDATVDQFFSRVVLQQQRISRTSTARYVLPVPLGSPKNTFGTGNLLGGDDRENFWAAVNGYCTGHESGDDKLTRWLSYSTGGSSSCNNGSAAFENYDPDGYLYAIELPENAPSLSLEIYDAAFNRSGSPSDIGLGSSTRSVTTIYEIYDRNDTPLDLSNLGEPIATHTLTTNQQQSTYQNRWVNFHTWASPQAGIYYLRVRTAEQTTNSQASNGFAIRAYTGRSFQVCTSIEGEPNYSASCPRVSGVSDISIYANLAGTAADFYLADVDPIHAGKTMRITLFDSGEGAQALEILDPNGNPSPFSWSTPCNPPTPPTGGCSGNGTILDVSGSGTQPYSPVVGSGRYNGRYVIIDIPLPVDYLDRYDGKTWWKVRYTVGTTPTDRTTWSASIVGDPVHLLD